jgi:hypothetical protein
MKRRMHIACLFLGCFLSGCGSAVDKSATPIVRDAIRRSIGKTVCIDSDRNPSLACAEAVSNPKGFSRVTRKWKGDLQTDIQIPGRYFALRNGIWNETVSFEFSDLVPVSDLKAVADAEFAADGIGFKAVSLDGSSTAWISLVQTPDGLLVRSLKFDDGGGRSVSEKYFTYPKVSPSISAPI